MSCKLQKVKLVILKQLISFQKKSTGANKPKALVHKLVDHKFVYQLVD